MRFGPEVEAVVREFDGLFHHVSRPRCFDRIACNRLLQSGSGGPRTLHHLFAGQGGVFSTHGASFAQRENSF